MGQKKQRNGGSRFELREIYINEHLGKINHFFICLRYQRSKNLQTFVLLMTNGSNNNEDNRKV